MMPPSGMEGLSTSSETEGYASRLDWRWDPSESYSDWTILVVSSSENEEEEQAVVYHVHRCMLATGSVASSYFKATFDHPLATTEQQQRTSKITLPPDQARCFPHLLDCFYHRTHLSLLPTEFVPMYKLVDYFGLRGVPNFLEQGCRTFYSKPECASTSDLLDYYAQSLACTAHKPQNRCTLWDAFAGAFCAHLQSATNTDDSEVFATRNEEVFFPSSLLVAMAHLILPESSSSLRGYAVFFKTWMRFMTDFLPHALANMGHDDDIPDDFLDQAFGPHFHSCQEGIVGRYHPAKTVQACLAYLNMAHGPWMPRRVASSASSSPTIARAVGIVERLVQDPHTRYALFQMAYPSKDVLKEAVQYIPAAILVDLLFDPLAAAAQAAPAGGGNATASSSWFPDQADIDVW